MHVRKVACLDFSLLNEEEKRYVASGGLILTGKLQEADVQNGNGRVYPHRVLMREMKNYQKLVEVNQKHPELGAQLPYLVAHAANSLYNNNRVPIADTGKGVKLNPPRTASTTAATPEKKQSNSSKQIDDLATRFKKSGNKNDFITLRTLQMQNKT